MHKCGSAEICDAESGMQSSALRQRRLSPSRWIPLASRLAAIGIILLGVLSRAAEVVAQSDSESVIAASSNLSAALPPGEWARVESAVDAGLNWLMAQQMADGRFPSDEIAQPAVTSLAIMAFLSRGHMPDQGRYGASISRAIKFVLSTQRRRGYFSLLPVAPPNQHLTPSQTVTYNHAIAGLMLGEVYGMTSGDQSRRIEAAISKALVYHRAVQTRGKKMQTDVGGWRYGYPDGTQRGVGHVGYWMGLDVLTICAKRRIQHPEAVL